MLLLFLADGMRKSSKQATLCFEKREAAQPLSVPTS